MKATEDISIFCKLWILHVIFPPFGHTDNMIVRFKIKVNKSIQELNTFMSNLKGHGSVSKGNKSIS